VKRIRRAFWRHSAGQIPAMIVAVLMLASSAGAQDHGLSVRELHQANATSAQLDSEPRRDRDWRRAGGRASLRQRGALTSSRRSACVGRLTLTT
jgi:hypothetical protein